MGHRMTARDEARRRPHLLGCDASKGAHIEAQGEFHLRRRIQILEEENAELREVADRLATAFIGLADENAALLRDLAAARSRRFPVEPMGTTAEPGW